MGEKLTKREVEVGTLLIQGLTARQAAKKLQISLRVARKHKKKIKKKLDCRNDVQAGFRFSQYINQEKSTL